MLVYATGGLAYGHVESTANTVDAPAPCTLSIIPCTIGPASGSASAWRAGWTIGGGFESALSFAPRWSVNVEYLYYDLGDVTYSLSPATVTSGIAVIGHINTTATADFRGNIVRAGLNYKL